MGMDGLSMSNTGVIKEQTSAEYNARTEQVVQQDPTNDAKLVQTTSTNRQVREKEDEEDGNKKRNQGEANSKEQETFDDGFVSSEDNKEENIAFDIEELENPNKDFYVKLNTKNDTIELYDSSTDRLVETISGDELGELMKKLNIASGIFVNKKV